MTQSRVRHYLEVMTSGAVILGAAVIICIGLWSHFRAAAKPQMAVSVGLRTGALLTGPPNTNYGGVQRTLIIAMNTRCGYCQASIPIYKQLAGLQNTGAASVRVVAAFQNDEDEVKEFLRQNHLNMETSSSVDFGQLRVTGTPTLILVNAKGEVRDFWIGKLSQDQEQQVIRGLTAPEV
jgi:thiol-disulfide isomerase/thioredoxin